MFDVAAHIHILNKISSKMLGTGQHLLKMLDSSHDYPTCCPLVRFSHIKDAARGRATGHARMVTAMISDILTAQRFAALQQRAGQTVV